MRLKYTQVLRTSKENKSSLEIDALLMHQPAGKDLQAPCALVQHDQLTVMGRN